MKVGDLVKSNEEGLIRNNGVALMGVLLKWWSGKLPGGNILIQVLLTDGRVIRDNANFYEVVNESGRSGQSFV